MSSFLWQLLSVSILLFSVIFGLFGNLLFILVLLRDKVLRKLAIVPLLVMYSLASLGQTIFIELLALHALVTNEHLGSNHPWICKAHQAAGFLFIPLSCMFLTFISIVRWLHYRGTCWIRRPRTRGRVFKRVSVAMLILGVSFTSIVFSGVPLSPNKFLFCDAYNSNETVPIWFVVWDNSIYIIGFILPSFITAGIYLQMFCRSSAGQNNPDQPGTTEQCSLFVRKHFVGNKTKTIRDSGITKGLLFTFIYGLLIGLPVIVGRHFDFSNDVTHLFTALALSNNSVVLLAFLKFCEVFRMGAALEVKHLIRQCGFKVNIEEENAWVPVWSGMRSRYIWVQTTYIDQTDVKCSILLCEKRPGRQPNC